MSRDGATFLRVRWPRTSGAILIDDRYSLRGIVSGIACADSPSAIKRASLATVVALIASIAGAGVSLYQERRAQARFNQVRELANKFIFEFEASIRDTPGTLSARRKMAETARQYLSSLEADSGHDPGLLRELAESHYRLSVVESEAQEYDAWLVDLKKAAAILRELKDDWRGPLAQRNSLCECVERHGSLLGGPDAQRSHAARGGIAAGRTSNSKGMAGQREWPRARRLKQR